MSEVEIKSRWNGEVICTGSSIKEAVQENLSRLRGANLSGANLGGANLGDAYLGDAYLGGATLAWDSHDLLSEILRRAAGDDIAKLKIAGLILVCREKCWADFAKMRDPLAGWSLDELAKWVVEGDGAPSIVRERSAAAEATA